jgi:hypothetical protein
VTRASVTGEHGGPPTQGEALLINVDITAREPVAKLQLSLAFRTLDGILVATLCSGDVRTEWNVEPGRHRITARLHTNQLLPRVLSMSVRLMRHFGSEIYDNVPEALTVTILERDVLGTGIPLLSDRGLVWMPADYWLESLNGS